VCKLIEEVPSYRMAGRLFATREEAVNTGLEKIASDLQRNHVNAMLPGLLKHRDVLLFLLGEHATMGEPIPKPDKDPAPEAGLDWRALDHQGHSPSCQARATGYASKCNCGARTDDADSYSGPDVTRSERLEP